MGRTAVPSPRALRLAFRLPWFGLRERRGMRSGTLGGPSLPSSLALLGPVGGGCGAAALALAFAVLSLLSGGALGVGFVDRVHGPDVASPAFLRRHVEAFASGDHAGGPVHPTAPASELLDAVQGRAVLSSMMNPVSPSTCSANA